MAVKTDLQLKKVNIFTDGACSGNQNKNNKGGWGCILEFCGVEKELCGGQDDTTNNRMELTALVNALKALKTKDLELRIFSDSSYLVNCFRSGWYRGWQKNGWKTAGKKPVENRDLWEELLGLLEPYRCEFYLIKGHLPKTLEGEALDKAYARFCENNPALSLEDFKRIAAYNDRCDELATRFQRGLL